MYGDGPAAESLTNCIQPLMNAPPASPPQPSGTTAAWSLMVVYASMSSLPRSIQAWPSSRHWSGSPFGQCWNEVPRMSRSHNQPRPSGGFTAGMGLLVGFLLLLDLLGVVGHGVLRVHHAVAQSLGAARPVQVGRGGVQVDGVGQRPVGQREPVQRLVPEGVRVRPDEVRTTAGFAARVVFLLERFGVLGAVPPGLARLQLGDPVDDALDGGLHVLGPDAHRAQVVVREVGVGNVRFLGAFFSHQSPVPVIWSSMKSNRLSRDVTSPRRYPLTSIPGAYLEVTSWTFCAASAVAFWIVSVMVAASLAESGFR